MGRLAGGALHTRTNRTSFLLRQAEDFLDEPRSGKDRIH
jgi:hypothetical protein